MRLDQRGQPQDAESRHDREAGQTQTARDGRPYFVDMAGARVYRVDPT